MARRLFHDSDDGSGPAGPRGGWLLPGPHWWAALAVLVLGLYFSFNTLQTERGRDLSERQAEVQADLSDFRARLETDIYASVALVRGLAVQVVLNEGITDAEFQAIAEELSAAPIQHIGKLLVLWRPLPDREKTLDEDRKPGPRDVKVLKYSKRGGQRPEVRTLRVLGNQRLTPNLQLHHLHKHSHFYYKDI